MGLSKSGFTKIEGGARKLSENYIRSAMSVFSASEREVLGVEPPGGKAGGDITPDDFERLKLACAYFVESFSEVEGAMQWIEALEQVVQMRKGEKRPIDREQLRAKAEAIADLAKSGLRPENRQGT